MPVSAKNCVTRFAPSPTGPLHLGHAFSALTAFDFAQKHGGQFLLRIEDLDQSRARDHWEDQIYQDLQWLGIAWQPEVVRQSERAQTYATALQTLWDKGLLYPCSCSRRDILSAVEAPQGHNPLTGPDGVIYPGTCRHQPRPDRMPADQALRLDMEKAHLTALSFQEKGTAVPVLPSDTITKVGDVVVARKDMAAAYHLAVVVDDAEAQVTHVVRGKDLFEATQIHVVLQSALGLPTPQYHHHELICDDTGKRLAKRDDARAIAKYRDEGATPADIRRLVGL